MKKKSVKKGGGMQQPNCRIDSKQSDEKSIESRVTHSQVRNITLLSALFIAVCITPILAQEPGGKDLRVFYQQHCASCHGSDGSALGDDGKKLRGRDFTNQDWQQGTSDEEMVKAIQKGKLFGLAMPSFKDTLTEDEIKRMVTDIIRKCKKGHVIAPDAE